jgi:hypothetical protein
MGGPLPGSGLQRRELRSIGRHPPLPLCRLRRILSPLLIGFGHHAIRRISAPGFVPKTFRHSSVLYSRAKYPMKADLRLATILAITFLGAISAQAGDYSAAGANAYVQSKDYQGLLKYATAWSKAEPNNPDGWSHLGVVYGIYRNVVRKHSDYDERESRAGKDQSVFRVDVEQ